MDGLVWPLHGAIASYCLGHYLGTIAICGTIAERLAILLFEMLKPCIRNRELTEGDQKRLWGRTFERLGQERRIDVLRVLGGLSDEEQGRFTTIRNARNAYLHAFESDRRDPHGDAAQVFEAAIQLMISVLGMEPSGNGIRLRPEFVDYLRAKGIVLREAASS